MQSKKVFHFDISERKLLLRIIDLLTITVNLVALNLIFDRTYLYFSDKFWSWVIVYCIFYLFFATVFELYVLKQAESRFKVIKNLLLSIIFSTLVFLFTPFITPLLPPNRLLILHFFTGNFILLLLWRFSYITFITSPRFYKQVLFVGESYDIDKIAEELYSYDPNYKIVGYFDTKKNTFESKNIKRYEIENIKDIILTKGVSEVVVANSYKGVNESIYKHLVPILKYGIPIKSYAKVYEETTKRILLKDVSNDFYCYFPFNRSNQNKLYLNFSRIVELIVCIVGIIFLFLLIPFVFMVNLFFNKGKLFYSQYRLGKSLKKFKILKFRTMQSNAEANGVQWSQKNDFRVTAFGKVLRKTRFDELPQFINIFKGEMRLIGPRPERPEFIEKLKQKIPFYETRLVIKPGLTGWAQVNANYANTEEETLEKLQYDLYYIKERSLFLDFKIIVKTISTIVFFRGH